MHSISVVFTLTINSGSNQFRANHPRWWFQTSLRSCDVTITLGSVNHVTFC